MKIIKKMLMMVFIIVLTMALTGVASAACDVTVVDEPSAGEYVSGTKTIEWTYSGDTCDSSTITAISFWNGVGWVNTGYTAGTIVANVGQWDWDSTFNVDTAGAMIRVDPNTGNFADSSAFTLDNTPPVADADGPYTCNEGDLIALDGTGSTDNLGILSYDWDLDNDAIYETNGATPNYNCTQNEGIYNIGLQVSDGANTDTDTSTVTISNVAPTVTITDPIGGELETGTFDITWTATDPVDTLTIDLEYSTDGWVTPISLASGIANSGTWSWDTTGIDSTTVQVRVTADDGTDTTSDTSGDLEIDNTNPVADAGADDSINEDQTYTMDGSGSFDPAPATSPISYAWDFNNDGFYDDAVGVSPVFDPAVYTTDGLVDGVYTIGLEVTDGVGLTDTSSMTLTVNNLAPTVAVTYPNGGEQLNGVFNILWTANDAVDTTLTIDIEYSDDSGATWNPLASGEANDGSYTWDTTGLLDDIDFLVRVTADDGTDTTSDDSDAIFEIDSKAPVAEANGAYTCDEGTTESMDSTGSDGSTIGILSIDWDLDNDAVYESAEPAAFSCKDDGVYNIGVQVTDNHLQTGTDTSTVTVNNVAPVLVIGADINDDEGTLVTASASCTDAGTLDTHTADFDWGDGNSDLGVVVTCDGNPFSLTHTYADDSIYTVTITVTDDDLDTDSDTLTATIANADPILDAGSNQMINEGDTLTLAATFTDAGSADTHTATIDWGDGSPIENIYSASSPITNTHKYVDEAGSPFTITITVVDDDGGSYSDTLSVTVSNVAPTVTITDPSNGDYLRGTVTIIMDAFDPGNDTIIMATSYSDDGGMSWNPIDSTLEVPLVNGTYTHSWDTTSVLDGTYRIQAILDDFVDLSAPFRVLGLTVDNTPSETSGPEVAPDPAVAGNETTFTATVADSYGVVGATLYVMDDLGVTTSYAMSASDLTFDENTEEVVVTLSPLQTLGWDVGHTYTFWVVGEDNAGNVESQDADNTDTFVVAAKTEYTIEEVDAMIDALQVQIDANAADIATNVADIAANAADILALDTRLTTAEADILANAADILALDGRLTTAEADILANAADILALDTRVSNNEIDISDLQTEVGILDTRLTTAEADILANAADILANAADILALDTRLTTAEADILANAAAIATNAADIAALDLRVQANAADIVLINAAILTIQGDVSALQARMTAAEADILALDTRLTTAEADILALDTRLTTAEADILALDTRLTTAEADILALDTRLTTAEADIDDLQDDLQDLQDIVDAYIDFQIDDLTADTATTTLFTLSVETSDTATCTYSATGDDPFTALTTGDGLTHSGLVAGTDGQLNIYEVRCTGDVDGYSFTKSRYVWVNVDTSSEFDGFITPLFGGGTSAWRFFFMPRMVLNDLDLDSYDVGDVLANIDGDYMTVWYHDPATPGVDGWSYYDSEDEFSTLTSMNDWDSAPYWIELDDTSITEIRVDEGGASEE